uniref:Kinase n=1 Tax=Trichuris muris TaxID=70415 RepID=A0A5S6Q7U4_TRIMR
MASSLSAVLAKVFMENLEEIAFKTVNPDCCPKFFKRYIDDVFAVDRKAGAGLYRSKFTEAQQYDLFNLRSFGAPHEFDTTVTTKRVAMGCTESRGCLKMHGCAHRSSTSNGPPRQRFRLRLRLPVHWSGEPQASCSAGAPVQTIEQSSRQLKLPEIVIMDPEMSAFVASVATVCDDDRKSVDNCSYTLDGSSDQLSSAQMSMSRGESNASSSSLDIPKVSSGRSPSPSFEFERHIRSILRRFPFPAAGRNSPKSKVKIVRSLSWRRDKDMHNNQPLTASSCDVSPAPICQQLDPVTLHAQHALNFMVMKSVETAVPVVVPLEKWLQDRLASWVQLSGHDGTIVPASDNTLWKKRASNDSNESSAYMKLMNDSLCPFVAKFYREVEYKCDMFIEIEDLTRHFKNPAIMDIKMGTRTFLESEVKNPVKRHDLYEKMVMIDPHEPTAEEHAEKAITKLRYMQFRERESSTAQFGFRIEAVKSQQGWTEKNFKRVKTMDQIMEVLVNFMGRDSKRIRNVIVKRLKLLRAKMERSVMFKTHEFIGSSLLFMYDDRHANVWMIDFAKVCPVEGLVLDHRSPWTLGNHEDGYLHGLDYLIQMFEDTKLCELPSLKKSAADLPKGNENLTS